MEITAGGLFINLLVSVVGFSIFLYGKKQARLPQLIAGVLLMVYPYLISNVLWMALVGISLLVGLILAVRLGY